MQNLETIFLSIAIFGSGVLVIFIIAKYSYLTKKVFAEKGVPDNANKMSYAEMACIVMGIALGLGVSSVFTLMDLPEDTTDMLVYATILMGGGFGLLCAHLIRKRREGTK
nr:hypothetical protein [uncultured Dyadobacter sp.]